MSEKKTPAIRFQGFTDDWEQQTLGNILITLPFKPYMKSPEQNGKYEIIQQGNEPIAGHANGSPCLNYTDLVIFGDHTLSLFKPESPFFVATDGVRILKGKANMNRNYLYALLQKYKPESEGYKRYYSILAKCKIWLTMNSNEQNRTGILFATIDNLIALHQHKLNKLQRLKKSMLTKMFPKDGARVPEIRFQGFHDDWRQCKYGDVINLLSGQDFSPSEYNDSGYGIPYMTGASCILDGKSIVNRWTTTPRCIAEKGDVLLVCKGSGYGTLARLIQEKAHIARQFMSLRCTDALDQNFNFYLASSVVKNIKRNARGLIAGVDRSAILNQNISLPNIDEQRQVGSYLNNLDQLIEIYQHKLSKLQKIKQAMLSKLFV